MSKKQVFVKKLVKSNGPRCNIIKVAAVAWQNVMSSWAQDPRRIRCRLCARHQPDVPRVQHAGDRKRHPGDDECGGFSKILRCLAKDEVHQHTYIGLPILAGMYRSWGEATASLCYTESGRTVFHATTQLKVLHTYCTVVRFNDCGSHERGLGQVGRAVAVPV